MIVIKVTVANGQQIEDKILVPIDLKLWVDEWIYLGLSFDYTAGNFFIFVKSFSSLGNEQSSVQKLSFPSFELKSKYQLVLGGIEKQNFQNFQGILYDWNMTTFYLDNIIQFAYILSGKSSTFGSGGNLFQTQFALAGGSFDSHGEFSAGMTPSQELAQKITNGVEIEDSAAKSERLLQQTDINKQRSTRSNLQIETSPRNLESVISIENSSPSPYKFLKTISLSNSNEMIKAGAYGLRFGQKDYIEMTGINLKSANDPSVEVSTPGVEKGANKISTFAVRSFFLYLNFSFKEIINDELIIFASKEPREAGGFFISLVEKSKEDFYKKFKSDNVHVINADVTYSQTYTYDSSLRKPKVLKLQLTSENNKILTFISPVAIQPDKQYRLIMGFLTYPPDIMRGYFQLEEKVMMSFEEGDIRFTFKDEEGNEKPFGGHINLNEMRILEAPHSFLQSGKVNTAYFGDCFPNCSFLGFSYSKHSTPFPSSNPNQNSYTCLECKSTAPKSILLNNLCETFCPFSYFLIKENKSCKKCNESSCETEIPRTKFTVSKVNSQEFSAVVEKKIFFKTAPKGTLSRKIDNEKLRNLGNLRLLKYRIGERTLQESESVKDEYCQAEIKTLKEGQDYTVKVGSSITDNILTCNAEFDLFRSFREKDVQFNLNPNLYSGSNVIIDENQNPVYLSEGIFRIEEFQRADSALESQASTMCVIGIILYAIISIICLLSFIFQRDNFIKWLWLHVTLCIHIFCFFISLDIELPILLREFLLCQYKHFIQWLGALRNDLTSRVPLSDQVQISSFNAIAAKISPFFFQNLMILFILHLIFLLFYLTLKLYEMIRIFRFKKGNASSPRKSLGSLRNVNKPKIKKKDKLPKNSLSKLDFMVFRVMRKIDIDVPLYSILLFMIPIVVFGCINLKYSSNTGHSLFLASTIFSVIYLLIVILTIAICGYYIYSLINTTKKYVSTDLEQYHLESITTNQTLTHFPKPSPSQQFYQNQKNSSNLPKQIVPAYGPYNLHFNNYINSRQNDDFMLEELYKHVVDGSTTSKLSGNVISKNVEYNQAINEDTERNYLQLLATPGWQGFNYRRPENINKLGILFTNLSLDKPFVLHFFFVGYLLVQFFSGLFMGLGFLKPGVQVVPVFLLQIALFVILCLPFVYKHKLIFLFGVLIQVFFLASVLGVFMVYADYSRDLTNYKGRDRMAQFTVIMFLLFLLVSLVCACIWIIMRKYKTKKFNELHFNCEIVDEPHLKYYKKIPDKIYNLGQMANDKEDKAGNSKTMELRTDVRAIPRQPLKPVPVIPSSETNNIVLKPKNFQLSQGPQKMEATGTIRSDVGDVVIQEQSFSEIDMGDLEYRIHESRAPGTKATDSWGKRRLKIKERERDLDLEEYQGRGQDGSYNDMLEVPLEIQKTINTGNNRPAGMMNDGVGSNLEKSEIENNFGFTHSHGGKEAFPGQIVSKPLDSGQMDITPNINFFRSQNHSKVQKNEYQNERFDRNKQKLNIGKDQKGYTYSGYDSSKNNLKSYSPTSTMPRLKSKSNLKKDNQRLQTRNESKKLLTEENFNRIMGQETPNENLGLSSEDVALEEMKPIQLNHSQFMLRDRFDKADNLK